MAGAWSEREVELIVEDYFVMLEAEIRCRPYSKTEHRRAIIGSLKSRSEASVERKHQNISAIMLELGIPYIDGYKPLRNYQRALLPDAVLDYLERHSVLGALLEQDVSAPADLPTTDDILRTLEAPPERRRPSIEMAAWERSPTFGYRNVDYLRKEALNHKLGEAGELFVIEYEKARLIRAERTALADRIEHTSAETGDRAGFDVHSYNENGTDRFIEAKTTRYGKETPFYVTRNEVHFSKHHCESYWLYRVYQFRRSPRLFHVNGSIEQEFWLRPATFVACA